MNVSYLVGKNSISLALNGIREVFPVGSEKHGKALAAIKAQDYETLKDILMVGHKQIKRYDKEGFILEDGVVYKNGEALPRKLGEYLVRLADDGLDCKAVLNFWERVKKNPSRDSAVELFWFLEKYEQTITEDGCFIGYRRVTSDFKDFYTGTFDNSVGAIVSMPREQVNADRRVGCSTGLHVANYNYAKNDYHAGEGHLIEVKVDPADVVSVPEECNEQKIRVCRYEVLSVCEEQRKDVLADARGNTVLPDLALDACTSGDYDCDEEDDDDYYDEEDSWSSYDEEEEDDEDTCDYCGDFVSQCGGGIGSEAEYCIVKISDEEEEEEYENEEDDKCECEYCNPLVEEDENNEVELVNSNESVDLGVSVVTTVDLTPRKGWFSKLWK